MSDAFRSRLVSHPPRQLSTQVLVAGGGPAGVACALAAARSGARTILCQDRPVLGGNASSEIRMHIMGTNELRRGEPMVCEPREGGIIEEIRLENAVHNAQRSASVFDLILYDKCMREPNLTLLLNTTVISARTEDRRIASIRATRESTEEQMEITADVFVDCTGDGRLGAEAGARFRHGREDRTMFGEPHAREQADSKTLGSSILMTARRHDAPAKFVAPPWARRFTEHELRHRLKLSEHEVDAGLEYGYWWAEWGGQLDTIRDNETIRHESLAITLGIWDHIKNSGRFPQAENWALEWISFVPGKRESRRFLGRTVMTESDVLTARAWPDAIAFGGWPIDLHPPEGVDVPDEPPFSQVQVPHLFEIPLGACLSADLDNLMFAGRNISATHVAFAATRVMATCAAMGQGVGTAAAMAVHRGTTPGAFADDATCVAELRQKLLADDAFLIGLSARDPRDRCRSATISASSETPEGSAENIRSGVTRSAGGRAGVHPDRLGDPGTHRWISAELPATLTLEWTEPVDVAEIRLVFDTGMHRPLTLTHSDAYFRRMHWGSGQPETVRAYRIEALVDDTWHEVVSEMENYHRLRVHPVDVVGATALRLHVLEAHEVDHARVFEMRVLAPVE